MNTRELIPTAGFVRLAPPEKAAAELRPALDYPSTQVGAVGNITVSYANSLGTQGQDLANQMLNAVAGPYQDMEDFFGISGSAVTVVIAPLSGVNDGSGGAYHYGCDFASGGILYLDATFAASNPLYLEVALYVAELSECFMGAQGRGWGCGSSNGEGLSRYLAEIETPVGTLNGFFTVQSWVSAGYPNWVDATEGTDRNPVSTGCAVAYIYWMRSLGYTTSRITQAAGATLAANYQALTGKTTAYADLQAAMQSLSVGPDDPFSPVHDALTGTAWSSNRLDVFGLGLDNALWHKWWDGGAWGGWESLGGVLSGNLSAVSWSANRIDIFGRGLDRALWHRWWDGSAWGGWESLGGAILSDPVAVAWGPDRLDVFALGTEYAMWHRWWDGSAWGGWESLGGEISSNLSAVSWSANRLDIFARGTDDALWHRWWDGGAWGGWESLGGTITSDPKAVAWGPNRLDVFARGTDGAMWHRWWDGSAWGGWESLGGTIASDPKPVAWSPNRLDVFARGTDGAMWHRWWDGSAWGGWESLGGDFNFASIPIAWAPDRLDIFGVGTDNGSYHKYWDGSAWGPSATTWEGLGGVLEAFPER